MHIYTQREHHCTFRVHLGHLILDVQRMYLHFISESVLLSVQLVYS